MRRIGLVMALITGLAVLWAAKATADALVTQFEARWDANGSIQIDWETSSETGTDDYFLFRAESPSGPWDDYIDWEPAIGYESIGASYSYTDTEVTPGISYYYRLEERASEVSSYFGPITPIPGTSLATDTPTATSTPRTETDSGVQPTATRQFTNTPLPIGTSPATTFTSPLPTPVPPRGSAAQPTSLLPPRITTPTPEGGVVQSSPTSTVSPTLTPTPPARPSEVGATATGTMTPTATPPIGTPTPSATPQRLAAVGEETAQPLLDANAMQLSSESTPKGQASETGIPANRLLSILGGAALVAAALLGATAAALAVAWRLHSR